MSSAETNLCSFICTLFHYCLLAALLSYSPFLKVWILTRSEAETILAAASLVSAIYLVEVLSDSFKLKVL